MRVNTELNRKIYEEKRRKAKKVGRHKKRMNMEQKLEIIEEHYKNKEIRNFYQEVKKTQGKGYKAIDFCRNKQGQMITDPQGRLDRWAEHFEELLNSGRVQTELENDNVEYGDPGEVEEPSDDEILEEINNQKNNKSGGENGITAEVLKTGGAILQQRICKLIRKMNRYRMLGTMELSARFSKSEIKRIV